MITDGVSKFSMRINIRRLNCEYDVTEASCIQQTISDSTERNNRKKGVMACLTSRDCRLNIARLPHDVARFYLRLKV